MKEGYPVPGILTSVDWVANFPDHYAGNATKASAEKGARIFEAITSRMAKVVQAIKADTLTAQIRKEFQRRVPAPPVKQNTEVSSGRSAVRKNRDEHTPPRSIASLE